MLLGLAQKSIQLKDLCKTSVELSNSENESERNGETSINIQAIKVTKEILFTDGRKKEFVYTQQNYILVIGQINKKNRSGRYLIQHQAINERDNNGEIVIQHCNGCALNDKRVNKKSHSCYFNKDRMDLVHINRIFNCQKNPNTKIIIRGVPEIM